ncbi:macrophage mannose receptor 1 isoform X1 [Nothobranchius furzeri]|uniref:Transcript variant X1 n=1 Tax=Nothobranchius furzeri TaxID=105023 RepID=A0A9D3BJW8_NOTFU|nr:transcript variant X1 [Nothobranchius furzeri]KAF7210685.1 transcript variant X2 [Nothobranchius furzeri]
MLQESRAAGMEKVVLFIVAASGPKAAPNISDRHVCMGGVYSEACVCVCVVAAPHFAAVHRYHFVYEVKNWTEAQRHCREKFTDLAIVDDMEDVDALIRLADLSQMVYPSYSQRAWIGLYDTKNIWMWSLADRDFYRNWETEFRNWGSGYPNSFGKYVYCVRMDSAGRWSDGTCGVSLDVICSDVKGQDATFAYINTTMNWTNAQSYCREHHTDLASVRNMSENQNVMKLIPAGQVAWIGLYRESWKWVNGRTPTFMYWSSTKPDGLTSNCATAYLSGAGRWEDWSCSAQKAFVCLSENTKCVVKLKLAVDSSVDLNESTVQRQILEQLKEKLQDQHLEDNLKLSWKKQDNGRIFDKDNKKEEM